MAGAQAGQKHDTFNLLFDKIFGLPLSAQHPEPS
jgi:hypothetical protein